MFVPDRSKSDIELQVVLAPGRHLGHPLRISFRDCAENPRGDHPQPRVANLAGIRMTRGAEKLQIRLVRSLPVLRALDGRWTPALPECVECSRTARSAENPPTLDEGLLRRHSQAAQRSANFFFALLRAPSLYFLSRRWLKWRRRYRSGAKKKFADR